MANDFAHWQREILAVLNVEKPESRMGQWHRIVIADERFDPPKDLRFMHDQTGQTIVVPFPPAGLG